MNGVIGCAGLFLLAVSVPATATTHRVPSGFTTIQAAMDAAAAGDTVLVAPGVYTDCDGGLCLPAVVVMKTGTTLVSEGGASVTTLRADTLAGSSPVVSAESIGVLGAEISGFLITASAFGRGGIGALGSQRLTVRNCRFEDLDNYGLALDAGALTSNSLEVVSCVFLRCVGEGACVDLAGVDVVAVDCLFEDCIGGALSLNGTGTEVGTVVGCTFRNIRNATSLQFNSYKSVLIEDCLFEGNDASPNSTGGVQGNVAAGKSMRLKDCVFLENTSRGAGGAVLVGGSGLLTIQGNSIVGSVGTTSGAAVLVLGTVLFHNNIVASTSGGTALRHLSGSIAGSCNVFWNNADGDVRDYTPDPTDSFVAPLFCDEVGGDIRVASNSPCLPENSNGCGLIGALGQGCGVISVDQTSWGRLKNLYREGE